MSTENVFKAMVYAQLTKAYSLNEIIKTLEANSSKLYHSGIARPKKSTLADALNKRSSRDYIQEKRCLVSNMDRTHFIFITLDG